MPISLIEDSDRVAGYCRKAEAACAALPTTHEWRVLLLDHFRDVPEAKEALSYATTPAGFRRSEDRV